MSHRHLLQKCGYHFWEQRPEFRNLLRVRNRLFTLFFRLQNIGHSIGHCLVRLSSPAIG